MIDLIFQQRWAHIAAIHTSYSLELAASTKQSQFGLINSNKVLVMHQESDNRGCTHS